jgi:hypothetical protein
MKTVLRSLRTNDNGFTELDSLEIEELGGTFFRRFQTAMEGNTHLKTIKLSYLTLTARECEYLGVAIARGQVNSLSLSQCSFIGNGFLYLVMGLFQCCSLYELEFYECGLTSVLAGLLFETMAEKENSIRSLSLTCNPICGVAWPSLKQCLHYCPKLNVLNLEDIACTFAMHMDLFEVLTSEGRQLILIKLGSPEMQMYELPSHYQCFVNVLTRINRHLLMDAYWTWRGGFSVESNAMQQAMMTVMLCGSGKVPFTIWLQIFSMLRYCDMEPEFAIATKKIQAEEVEGEVAYSPGRDYSGEFLGV